MNKRIILVTIILFVITIPISIFTKQILQFNVSETLDVLKFDLADSNYNEYDDEVKKMALLADKNLNNVDVSEVNWIFLSYDGYDDEKEAIKTYLKRTNAEDVPIAIGLYDLNHDGSNEIIAFISDVELHGAKESGCLVIFIYDEYVILNAKWIAGFPLYIQMLDNPSIKQIGIINTGEEWDDLFINAFDAVSSYTSHWNTKPD